MPESRGVRLGDTGVHAIWTGREEGDLAPPSDPGPDEAEWALRAQEQLARPWSFLRQVHGARVVVVGTPGEHAGATGDALVSADGDGCLAVFTADCASVALGSREGVMGAVHAGWRGIRDGVIEGATTAMAGLGARRVVAGLGPCIHPCCCNFSPCDLDAMARRLGPTVRATSRAGGPSLDVPAAVEAALGRASAATGTPTELVSVDRRCTVCTPGFFSHRARGDAGRQAMIVWCE